MNTLTGSCMLAEPAAPPCEPDLMLLHRFTETGDARVFAEIVQRYARVVYSASIRVLGDEGRAQDVSQETFFRLMQRPKLVTHSLAGWLHRTATHLALDVRRSEISRRQREQTYGLEQQQNKSARPSWAEVSPYIDQALNEIEEPSRGLLIRHFLQGVPQADLAAELDVSPATLSRRMKAGLDELQQHLRKKGIHLAATTLAVLCTTHVHAAVPTAFVSEMAKMNLIAAVRHAAPPPMVKPPPSAIQIKLLHPEYVPAKFAWTLIGMMTVAAMYACATAASWTQTRPFVSAPVQHLPEPTRALP